MSFRTCPISFFEIPKSSAILKHTAQGIFSPLAFSKRASSNFFRSAILSSLFLSFSGYENPVFEPVNQSQKRGSVNILGECLHPPGILPVAEENLHLHPC